MTQAAMEGDKHKPIVRRPDVLRKFTAENLLMIERGLLGDLPDKLKPQPFISRATESNNLEVAKPSGLLALCLPITEVSSTVSEIATPSPHSDDEVSPLKKSFSFRDKFSRISFFGKDKVREKPKWKIGEDEKDVKDKMASDLKRSSKAEYDYKSQKRFWFFRQKDIDRQKEHSPIYKRSKSFEFLPRAIEEEDIECNKKLNRQSSFFEMESMGDSWMSNESLEYISNVYYDNEDGVFLKSIKEFPSESSSMTNNNSSMSTVASASSTNAENIFKTTSVMNLLDEFNKAVDLFSENYLSDCEPYTKSTKQIPLKEKRKSSSFSNIPSPKVFVPKVNEISEDFKEELSQALRVKKSVPGKPRRGSVTDWFVLEDRHSEVKRVSELNKYRRGQKKAANRVRRMSSTKYWITPEECAVYAREQRPPLVIPRITPYRAPRQRLPMHYTEDSLASMRNYDRLENWSPTSEKTRAELERSFSKPADSPPFTRPDKRLGGSTENLLVPRRPHHIQLPATSSGDSLDVEIRGEHAAGRVRGRQVRSFVHRLHSPVPAPRTIVPLHEAQALLEGTVKRTKFFEGGKKSKKNWTDGYMILTATALYVYKDLKTYYKKADRAPGTPPSPTAPQAELVLPLRNARVQQCKPMHTRRHTRSLVLSWDCDQYLVQYETEETAKRWYTAIQSIMNRQYPLLTESPHYQSSNTDLESLGRTPPASRHQTRNKRAGGSSNEDLSDSTEVSKSHVRSRLRKFFAKRPAMEVLVKKGIYKDEPVFGRNLDEVCTPGSVPRVPEFVVACITEIERDVENMCTDGLYRASGNLSQVQKIRLEIDQNNMNVIKNNNDIHVLTGSLKLFFRELKKPLIPCDLFDRVLAACSIKPKEAKIKEFREIIQALPDCNRDTLKYLLEHLLRVTQYSDRNRMHTANLAIVFGPTLLWAPAEQAHNIAVDCIQQNNVVDILLNEFHNIFVEDDSKGKKKA